MSHIIENFKNKPVGIAIQELRQKQDKALHELTDICGGSPVWLSNIERGEILHTRSKGNPRLKCIFEQLGSSYEDYLSSNEIKSTDQTVAVKSTRDKNRFIRQARMELHSLQKQVTKSKRKSLSPIDISKAEIEVMGDRHPDNV